MLIMSQNRKSLLNVEQAGEIHLSSAYGDYREGQPVKVLASFPLAEDVTVSLGEYESEDRAVEVLEEIGSQYGHYLKADGTCNPITGSSTSPFAFAPPKVYRMPKK